MRLVEKFARGDNDDGLCTTAGVAAQYKFWDNFSAELGVAHAVVSPGSRNTPMSLTLAT